MRWMIFSFDSNVRWVIWCDYAIQSHVQMNRRIDGPYKALESIKSFAAQQQKINGKLLCQMKILKGDETNAAPHGFCGSRKQYRSCSRSGWQRNSATVCKQNTVIMARRLKWFHCADVHPHKCRRIFVIKAFVVCTKHIHLSFIRTFHSSKLLEAVKTVSIVQTRLNAWIKRPLSACNQRIRKLFLFRGFAVRQACIRCLNHQHYDHYYVFSWLIRKFQRKPLLAIQQIRVTITSIVFHIALRIWKIPNGTSSNVLTAPAHYNAPFWMHASVQSQCHRRQRWRVTSDKHVHESSSCIAFWPDSQPLYGATDTTSAFSDTVAVTTPDFLFEMLK